MADIVKRANTPLTKAVRQVIAVFVYLLIVSVTLPGPLENDLLKMTWRLKTVALGHSSSSWINERTEQVDARLGGLCAF